MVYIGLLYEIKEYSWLAIIFLNRFLYLPNIALEIKTSISNNIKVIATIFCLYISVS